MDDDPQSTTQERVSIIISIETVHGEMYSIQHYMIKFLSDLRQVGGTLTVREHMDSSQFVCGVCLVVGVVLFALDVFVLCLVSNVGCVSGFSLTITLTH
jgi:hypothetical protein